MSAALSGHLVDSFYSNPSARLPGSFVQPMASTPHIVTSQAMSFAPSMHGGVQPLPPCLDLQPTSIPQHTAMEIAVLQAKLNQKLGPEYISQRPGPAGGPKLTYAEGWKIINIANEVFGFNGWSSSVVSLTVDFIDFNDESKRYTVGVTAIVRVTLRYGVFHEDIGYGMLENSKSKGAALDKVRTIYLHPTTAEVAHFVPKCKKEAVTDGLKRTLRNFGNVLGNCLYDKSYTQEIVKIKVPPVVFRLETCSVCVLIRARAG
jgi:DNA repair and recombination protein RAD52